MSPDDCLARVPRTANFNDGAARASTCWDNRGRRPQTSPGTVGLDEPFEVAEAVRTLDFARPDERGWGLA